MTAAKTSAARTSSAKTAAAPRRRPRPAAKPTSTPSVLDGLVAESVLPAEDSPELGDDVAETEETEEERQQKLLHVNDYTVDLLDEGSENEKRDYAKLLDKAPNETHAEFVAWFEKKAGYRVDEKTVQVVLAVYAEFQRSPEHRETTHAKRAAASAKKAAAQKAKMARLQKAADELAAMTAAAK